MTHFMIRNINTTYTCWTKLDLTNSEFAMIWKRAASEIGNQGFSPWLLKTEEPSNRDKSIERLRTQFL